MRNTRYADAYWLYKVQRKSIMKNMMKYVIHGLVRRRRWRAPDDIREDLQLEVDNLFSAMKRIEENKIEASFDHKLEYDKWCNTQTKRG